MKNYYHVLGLEENASQDSIKKAYKLFALKLHPDRHQNDTFFNKLFLDIKTAYDVLSNPSEKAKYDSGLKKRGGNDTDLRFYQSKVKELNARIRELEASSDVELSAELRFYKLKIADLDKAVKDLSSGAELSFYRTKVAELNVYIKELEASNDAELAADLRFYKLKVTDLNTEITDLKNQIHDLKTKKTSVVQNNISFEDKDSLNKNEGCSDNTLIAVLITFMVFGALVVSWLFP
jgi:curved DNA-binding protein CbpA